MSDGTKDDTATAIDEGAGTAAGVPAGWSAVESIKVASDYLRGTLAEELASGTDHFDKATVQLIKHHGSYQQDDREARDTSGEGKSKKTYIFMVRTKVPGGRLTAAQMLAELDLGDELGNSTTRLTTRQGIQHHGIPMGDLRESIRRINKMKLTTISACGDVCRNVMAPCGFRNEPAYAEARRLCDRLTDLCAPRTGAYYELWLKEEGSDVKTKIGSGGPGDDNDADVTAAVDRWINDPLPTISTDDPGRDLPTASTDVEPLYGKHYLPRKFKIVVALPHENSVDIYAHDLGFLAIVRDGHIVGYNVLVGGGFGMTPANKKTFAAIAKMLCSIRADQALDVAVAVMKVQRDYGNRVDRKQSRLKYLIAKEGLTWFKARVEEYYGGPLDPPTGEDVTGFDDGMGWTDQGDGKFSYGLNIENGRIADFDGGPQLKAALREILRTFDCPVAITPHQSLIFGDLPASAKSEIDAILTRHGVRLSGEISTVRRWSMACVALPTCGLAITESERALPGIIDELEPEVAKLGLGRDVFTLRMTGCPNGCARPYNSDIGIVGKAKDKYTLYLGGRLLGNRMNFIYKDLVPRERLVPEIVSVMTYYKAARQDGESFGDFCARVGKEDLLAHAAAA